MLKVKVVKLNLNLDTDMYQVIEKRYDRRGKLFSKKI